MSLFAIEVPAPIRSIAGQWAADYVALTRAIYHTAGPEGITDQTQEVRCWLWKQLTLFRELARAEIPVLANDQVLSAIEQSARDNVNPSRPDGLTKEAGQVLEWLASVEKRPVWDGRGR
jgi:hypothetical protein